MNTSRGSSSALALKGKQPKTVDAYARALEDLLAYFASRDINRVIEAEETDLDHYFAQLRSRRRKKRGRGGMVVDASPDLTPSDPFLSPNTIAQRRVVCRLFYAYLLQKRLRQTSGNPVPRESSHGHNHRREQLPWIPTTPEWQRLLVHLLTHEDRRMQAMVLLAYDGALRREELMLLRMSDIDWSRGVLTIRPETTKGGRLRFVPITAGVLSLLKSYIVGNRQLLLSTYGGDPSGPLFLSESTRNPGKPLAIGAFDEIMERLRTRVQLPALTPHTLRHLRCTTLKRAGVTLEDIALFAGHKSLESTRLYLHLTPEELGRRLHQHVATHDAVMQRLIASVNATESNHDR